MNSNLERIDSTDFKNRNFLKYLQNADSFKGKSNQKENYSVIFSPETEDHCVGMVDMVNSTKISAVLQSDKMARYYQVFLNSMSRIINEYDGNVIKNIGDCLLFYFPNQANETQEEYLIKSLDCSFKMISIHDVICEQLRNESLPCLDYRISLDYGKVILMKINNSESIDMIGTPINLCSKINHNAPPNGIVAGGDIYEMIKKIDKYHFEQIKGYSFGLKADYSIYIVNKNNHHII